MRVSVVQNVKSDFWFQIELEEGNSKLWMDVGGNVHEDALDLGPQGDHYQGDEPRLCQQFHGVLCLDIE